MCKPASHRHMMAMIGVRPICWAYALGCDFYVPYGMHVMCPHMTWRVIIGGYIQICMRDDAAHQLPHRTAYLGRGVVEPTHTETLVTKTSRCEGSFVFSLESSDSVSRSDGVLHRHVACIGSEYLSVLSCTLNECCLISRDVNTKLRKCLVLIIS